VQIIADRPHHHLAGVEPHSHLDTDAMRTPCCLSIGADGGLHGEGRITGADGMVFMRNGGAEQGHDAIPHDLVDRAFVAVDGRHHAFQDRIKELPGFLRIPVG
jgi:hypothetical protein